MIEGTVLTEYCLIGVSGTEYHPTYNHGGWVLNNSLYSYTLTQLGVLFDIPDDEMIILKLKYGS